MGKIPAFKEVFGSQIEKLEFEYRFFLEHLEKGFREDLCGWDWKKKFIRSKKLRKHRVSRRASGPRMAASGDIKGATWVYVRARPRVFERSPITIRNIDGEDVFLTAGPDTGTQVVTVGTPELFGAEQEIGAESERHNGARLSGAASGSSYLVGWSWGVASHDGLDRRSSLRFRFLVVAGAAALLFFGVLHFRTRRSMSSRSSRRRGSRSRRRARALRERGGGAGHRPAGAGAQRDARPRRDALQVGAAAVVDRADLQARDRPPARARQLVQERIADRDAAAADLGGAAGHDPAGVGDEPRHEDRAVVRRRCPLIDMSMIAYWTIRARLLRVPGVANVADLGRAAAACRRCRSIPSGCRRTTSRSTRSWRPPPTRWTSGCCSSRTGR